MTIIRALAILTIFTFVGCASALYPGPWTHVPVTTNPPGATLRVAGYSYTSPALVWVPRGLGDFKLSIYKKGYRSAHVFLRQSPDKLLANNIGMVGMAAAGPIALVTFPIFVAGDMLTGAGYDVEPEVVDFVLVPDEIYQRETEQ